MSRKDDQVNLKDMLSHAEESIGILGATQVVKNWLKTVLSNLP